MKLDIVKAAPEDAARIIAVQNAAFYDDYCKYGRCPAYMEPEDVMKTEIADGRRIAYLATADGEDAGNTIVRDMGNGAYYIRVLAVIPKFQNLHIGKNLLEFLRKTYPGARSWELITPKDNLRNCRFYERNGFAKTGERKEDERLTLNLYKNSVEQEERTQG
jgi:Acetyltransferases